MHTVSGISHVSLTVADLVAARTFGTEVMGFRVVIDEPGFCICIHPEVAVPVGFKDHDGTVTGHFDETRVGLDHIAFSVADLDQLQEWARALTDVGVPHSGITESLLGHHLNLRAPDNVAVELFVIGQDVRQRLNP